jgi:serine/threonine protein kinase/tetratricopeptide (TPR) repeat protein
MADPNTERDPLEVLAAEYMERLRQGQRPSIEEYAARHPGLAEEIRDLFPTIAVTERLKARQAQSTDGRATLGPARLERLGDFRIIREIGRGGMGVVFEAEQESLGRRVAVKVLPRQVLLDEKHLKRFEREARIAANLHHTNIVEVFGVGEQDGFHYYVMQFIRGVGLDAIIPLLAKLACSQGSIEAQPTPAPATTAVSENAIAEVAARQLLGGEAGLSPSGHLGPQYWQSVARIGLQAADALNYAHNLGTLHRDIKPANLLLDTQGTVWLADFGLAKAAQSDDLSLSNDLVGTLRYMAPEQFRGNADHRSDIYSLGLSLYELLTLRPAYEETDHSRLIQRITQGPPPTPSSATHEIPRDLETIILKAVSQDVSQRYQSAEAMAEDLRCFLEDRPIRARRVGPMERLGHWCRRNKSLASLTGSTLFLLVMIAVVASVGYVRTKNALQGEALERAKANANAGLAIEVLDRLFERLSPTRMRILPQPSMAGARGETINVPSSPMLSREAAELLEAMLPFYDRLARQSGNGGKLRGEIAQANRRVGAIRQRLGQFDEAVKAYKRAIALYDELRAGSPANLMLNLEVAQIENELGRLYTSRRHVAEAREAHLAALALLQEDGASPSTPAAMCFELARTYYFLGTQERPLPAADPRQGAGPAQIPNEQRERLAKAVALLKALPASPAANPEYQHLLALCYLEGAAVEDASRPEAKGGAELAIEILAGLVQALPGIPDYAFDLSEAYARIHIPQPPIPPETQKTIEDRFGKSLALLERLVTQHPDVPDFLAAEARIHDKLGSFHRQMERWADAEQNFREAIAIQAPLVKQFPDVPYYGFWMATFRIALADALIRRNQPAEARTELEETISTLLRQLEQKPDIPPPHDLLALGYSKLAVALRQAGDAALAEEAARKAQQERDSGRRSP